jgi:hypothetical protein
MLTMLVRGGILYEAMSWIVSGEEIELVEE